MRALPTHPTLRHPLTGEPLQALGYTRRGRVIWPILGGSGDGDGAGDGGTGDGDGKGDGKNGGGDGKEPNIDGDFDADRAKRTIAAARAAEQKAKDAEKAAKERLASVLKAAGLGEDGKPDPEAAVTQAAKERDEARKAARDASVQLAVYRQAGKAGANPDALLDSRAFATAVAELDPAAADFADKVEAAIKAALKANPTLAATASGAGNGTQRQGADHSGGGTGKTRPTSLGAALAARATGK